MKLYWLKCIMTVHKLIQRIATIYDCAYDHVFYEWEAFYCSLILSELLHTNCVNVARYLRPALTHN